MTPHPPRVPPGRDDLALFVDHLARTERFSDHLGETRCRHTGHFDRRLSETLAVLAPLVSAWNTEILFVLRFRGPLRFNRILGTLSPISPRVLTDKLRHLEAHGYVQRIRREDHTVYTLTERGARTTRLLHPLLYYLHNADAIEQAPAPARAVGTHRATGSESFTASHQADEAARAAVIGP